ncbi:hypothetical protein GCK32_010973 [Trichostrongylus colubriformis]|uniref:Uncharacterized protein n=1 Tax=Trichostrongylus colubriformis TaxID=6319 RepID=A0AAN8FR66_TRICO
MLSVYFKIFRVASEREALMRQSLGTCRLSNKLMKNHQNNRNNLRTASAPSSRMRVQMNNPGRVNYSVRPIEYNNRRQDSANRQESRSTECDDSPNNSVEMSVGEAQLLGPSNGSENEHRGSMERECYSMADLANGGQTIPKRKSTEVSSDVPAMTRRAQAAHARLQPNNLLAKVCPTLLGRVHALRCRRQRVAACVCVSSCATLSRFLRRFCTSPCHSTPLPVNAATPCRRKV